MLKKKMAFRIFWSYDSFNPGIYNDGYLYFNYYLKDI